MITHWNVFVVDDEIEINKKYYEMFLSKDYFNVRWAGNKSEFLGQDLSIFDFVVLDVNLDFWGISFVAALTKIGSSAPVVLVSSKIPEEKTLVRILEGTDHADSVSILHIFDMSLLASLEETKAKDMAMVYCALLRASVKRKDISFIEPNQEVRILHLSDPQYGDPGTEDWSAFIESDIAKFVKDRYPRIDFITITGDIVYSGKHEEYKVAHDSIERLLKGVIDGGPGSCAERLVLVPGNHDVDYRMSAVPISKVVSWDCALGVKLEHDFSGGVGDNASQYAMFSFRVFAYGLTRDYRWLSSEKLNWIDDRFSSFNIRFINLNSAEEISWRLPSTATLNEASLSGLQDAAFEDSNSRFTIAVSHHGPTDPDYPDTIESIDDDWPAVSNFMRNANVKLWLHGHGHRRLTLPFPYGVVDPPMLDELKLQIEKGNCFLKKNQFVRVMAPTTHLAKSLRPPEERKGFNVIVLSRENGFVTSIDVHEYVVEDIGPRKQGSVKFKCTIE